MKSIQIFAKGLSLKIIYTFAAIFFTTQARAQFLDFSQPARAAALGGNLVALPLGSSALAFNPAGLGLQDRFGASARYEAMFQGLENDNVSTGNISLLSSPDSMGAFGGAWDHLGSDLIQQDRFSLAWGRKFPVEGFIQHASIGLSLSYLTQRFVLTQPLAGVSTSQLSASAFGFGGGILLDLPLNLSAGLSADNLNQPNLGIVGADRLPILGRWGLADKLLSDGPVRLVVTVAQSLSDTDLETQGGIEMAFPECGIHLRGGLGTYEGAVGAGYENQDFSLDYAYLFSASADSQLAGTALPGSHLLELGVQWGTTSDESLFTEHLRKAREAESAGQWDQALWNYQEMLTLKPGDKTALEGREKAVLQFNYQRAGLYYQEGLAAEQKGSLFEARDDFEMAHQLNPNSNEYSKSLEQTTAKSQQAAALPSPSDQLLTTQADLYLSKGRPDLAKKDLVKALQSQPQNLELKTKLARLENLSHPVSADKAELSQRLYEKGLQKYMEGDLDGAIRCWEDALRLNPGLTRAQNNLVHAQLEKESEKP